MTERIQNMVSAILKKTIYPEQTEVSYDRADYLLPERYRSTKRICEYMLAQTVAIPENALMIGTIKFDKCPYPADFMTKEGFENTDILLTYFYGNVEDGPFENFKFFEWQHATGDFGKIIEVGLEGLKQEINVSLYKYRDDAEKTEFLNACTMMCDGIIAWADKCAQESYNKAMAETNIERKNQLIKMSENLRRVPRYPARNFYEAIQCLYFCFDFLPDSIGLPDRWLYKYYIHDIENGVITQDFAKELLQELFIKIQSYTPLENHQFVLGGQCNFSLGGYTADGQDGYNELSELILTSLLELPLYIPEVTFRWTKKTPTKLFHHIMDLARNDKHQRVAFVSDEAKVACLMNNCGLSWEEAIDYVTVGCNALALSGGAMCGSGRANLGQVLNDTFYADKEAVLRAETFEDFFAIYEKNLYNTLSRNIELGNKFLEIAAKDECILASLFLKGCVESGLSLNKGGAVGFGDFPGDGLICSIDSLAIIKQFVYDEKIITCKEILDALENNWQGYKDLRNMIISRGNFFGNDDDSTNEIAARITTCISSFAKDKTDALGKRYIGIMANGYRDYNTWFGKVTRATPDGRHDRESFKVVGAGQTNGRDRNGLTALLSSVGKYDPTNFYSGITVTNVSLDPELIYNDKNLEKTVKLFETYFLIGGAQFQFNAISAEELSDAKKNPDKHKNLRVRVSGYSDFFTNLTDTLQDSIIERTIHK